MQRLHEHEQYKAGALKTTSKTKWKYFKITLLSFEITGMHMYNMYKCAEK